MNRVTRNKSYFSLLAFCRGGREGAICLKLARQRYPRPVMADRPPLVMNISGVTYRSDSGHETTVSAPQIYEKVVQLAAHLRCRPEELLANDGLVAGEKLACKLVSTLPPGWGRSDASGYILCRFKGSKAVDGQSYLGGGTEERAADYMPPRSHHKPKACDESPGPTASNRPLSPPRRSKRSKKGGPSYCETSPSMEADVGRVCPLLERYHKVIFHATCNMDRVPDGCWVLHACGNKKCAVASHFYLGSAKDNERDEEYHRHTPNTSRIDRKPLQ